MAPLTDTQSNAHALETLVPRIRARARRLSRDADAAQDLAQETALRLWQRLQGDARIDDLEAYAMITLRNLATSGWRRADATEVLYDDQATCLPCGDARLALQDLFGAISRLPDEQAQLLTLVAAGETSPKDLADRTGLPTGTVMSRLGRARHALRVDLELAESAPVSTLF